MSRAAMMCVLLLASLGPARAAERFDHRAWLERPYARLLVVEVVWDKCGPCLNDAPRWTKLRRDYADRGLRLVVFHYERRLPVAFGADQDYDDPDGGRIRVELGVDPGKFPMTLVWSWRGERLFGGLGGFDEVAPVIQRFFDDENPRAEIYAPSGGGRDRALEDEVRKELARHGTLEVVISEQDRSRIDDNNHRDGGPGHRHGRYCEPGQALSRNSELKVTRSAVGDEDLLELELSRVDTKCVIAVGSSRGRQGEEQKLVAEAVADLQSALRVDRGATNAPSSAGFVDGTALGPGLRQFAGVRTELPIVDVTRAGFRECWRSDYNPRFTTVAGIREVCDGPILILGCGRLTDLERFKLAAMGTSTEVFGADVPGVGPGIQAIIRAYKDQEPVPGPIRVHPEMPAGPFDLTLNELDAMRIAKVPSDVIARMFNEQYPQPARTPHWNADRNVVWSYHPSRGWLFTAEHAASRGGERNRSGPDALIRAATSRCSTSPTTARSERWRWRSAARLHTGRGSSKSFGRAG